MVSRVTHTQVQRQGNRAADALRDWSIEPGWAPQARGSALVRAGNTWVLCTASVEDRVPPFLRNTPSGWVTAEYSMLPNATRERVRRERGQVKGRTLEIERLISRVLRQAVDLKALRGLTVHLDCDVLQADGGTRTASITGATVALAHLFSAFPELGTPPTIKPVVAISAGIVQGALLLDLDYREDSRASMDLNVACAVESGSLLEVQATVERGEVPPAQFQELLALATEGCRALEIVQRAALADL